MYFNLQVKGQSVNAPQKMKMYNGLPQSVKAEEGAKGAMLASTVYKYVPTKHNNSTLIWLFMFPQISVCGYKKQNKKRPLFHPPIQPESKVVSAVPVELMCVICTRLMVDAVIVPCCGYSFCDNCEFLLSFKHSEKCHQPQFCLCLFRHQDHSDGVRGRHVCGLPAGCFPGEHLSQP